MLPVPPHTTIVAQSLEAFQRELDIRFRDPQLLQQALTHRSFLGSNGGDPNLSNERMEFLGDAVLELVVIEHLYARYPAEREGNLTKKKGLLVSRRVLSESAKFMGLGRFILLSEAERSAGGQSRASILADAFEAVIGAVYLDRGLPMAREFIRKTLLSHTDKFLNDLGMNWKSQLQELVQAKYRTHPRYRVVTEFGPDPEATLRGRGLRARGGLLGRVRATTRRTHSRAPPRMPSRGSRKRGRRTRLRRTWPVTMRMPGNCRVPRPPMEQADQGKRRPAAQVLTLNVAPMIKRWSLTSSRVSTPAVERPLR
ncbi:MAG: ribonuclease III [Candidatus Eisenbacteria bacterium]